MKEQSDIPKPTDSEMEVLEFLWEQGSATVRQVNDRINQRRETGYTTTLKIMQIMHAKGMLERIEEGRTHIYTPLVGERQTRQKLLDRFLETTFRGSAASLVLQALGTTHTTRDELTQIRRLLDQLEQIGRAQV